MSNGTLTQEQRTALANTYGFMRDLCDVASSGLSGLQAQAAPDTSGDDDLRDLDASAIIIIKCKPMELPQPPTSSANGCFTPEHIRDRYQGVVDVEGLGMLFEHLKTICDEILTDYGTPDADMS